MIYSIGYSYDDMERLLSNDFREQLKEEIGNIILNDFKQYIKPQKIWLNIHYRMEDVERFGGALFVDKKNLMAGFSNASIHYWGICGLFENIKIFWKNETDESIIYPNENFYPKKIRFWMENYPSEGEIQEKINNMKDLWTPTQKQEKIVKEKFGFKVNESPELRFNLPDLTFVIKSKGQIEEIEKTVNKSIEVFNEQALKTEGEGVIHYYNLEYKDKNRLVYKINLGSAEHKGLLFLLEKLDSINIPIQYVSLG